MLKDRAKILRPIIQTALDEGGVDAIVDVVCKIIDELEARITGFESRVAELERRLNKNSSNSSKPPSSDGLKRTNSLRPKNSGRKPGGQPGHPGQNLRPSESPEITVNLPLNSCPECGGDLTDQPVESEEKRQVFDLPDIEMLVTEYLAQRKTCPRCGALVSAGFPCGVTAPVQYGPGMQSAMTCMISGGLMTSSGAIIPAAMPTCCENSRHSPKSGTAGRGESSRCCWK